MVVKNPASLFKAEVAIWLGSTAIPAAVTDIVELAACTLTPAVVTNIPLAPSTLKVGVEPSVVPDPVKPSPPVTVAT